MIIDCDSNTLSSKWNFDTYKNNNSKSNRLAVIVYGTSKGNFKIEKELKIKMLILCFFAGVTFPKFRFETNDHFKFLSNFGKVKNHEIKSFR